MRLDASSTLSDVLAGFASLHPSPRPDDVVAWQARYPHYGIDLLKLALTLSASECQTNEADWLELRDGAGIAPDVHANLASPSLEEQRAQYVKFRKRYHGSLEALPADATFQDLVLHFGTDYPTLAAHLDIAENIISHIGHGELLEPYGVRLVEALALALDSSSEQIAMILDRSRARPNLRFGTGRQYSLAELVDRADMTPERKAYWLGDE